MVSRRASDGRALERAARASSKSVRADSGRGRLLRLRRRRRRPRPRVAARSSATRCAYDAAANLRPRRAPWRRASVAPSAGTLDAHGRPPRSAPPASTTTRASDAHEQRARHGAAARERGAVACGRACGLGLRRGSTPRVCEHTGRVGQPASARRRRAGPDKAGVIVAEALLMMRPRPDESRLRR